MTALDVESLARRFEPILYFHRGEKFFPSDAKRYVEHAALWRSLFPIDQKGSWGAGPLIAQGSISALPAEAGTFLGTQILYEPSELRFLELAGWKNKAEALEPTVTPTSDNSYSHHGVDPGDGGIATLYNSEDAAGGNKILRESRFWYHAEGFDTERLRRLLGSVRAPELVKVLDNAGLQNPALLCFYFFYPAHEESLADACTNVEAREFACFGGEWGCLAILLERDSDSVPFRPTFIGYSGRPVASAGAAQGGTSREVMKVSRFSAADRTDEHPKLFVARGTHSLYLEPGNQGVHDVDTFANTLGSYDCGVETSKPGPSDLEQVWEAYIGLYVLLAKMVMAGFQFPGLGHIAGAWWGMQEFLDSDSEPVNHDQPAPDQGPSPGNLGRVLHPAGLTISEPGAHLQPWKSARDVSVDGRRYDFIVDRARQVWWPGDTPTTGFEGGPGYRGLWGPAVTNDPHRRRSGMAFPDFWKSFFLAFADGKAKSLF
jgi:hypothetical protein